MRQHCIPLTQAAHVEGTQPPPLEPLVLPEPPPLVEPPVLPEPAMHEPLTHVPPAWVQSVHIPPAVPQALLTPV
jgi:hypothetical protein